MDRGRQASCILTTCCAACHGHTLHLDSLAAPQCGWPTRPRPFPWNWPPTCQPAAMKLRSTCSSMAVSSWRPCTACTMLRWSRWRACPGQVRRAGPVRSWFSCCAGQAVSSAVVGRLRPSCPQAWWHCRCGAWPTGSASRCHPPGPGRWACTPSRGLPRSCSATRWQSTASPP